jgi:hypothetical protein
MEVTSPLTENLFHHPSNLHATKNAFPRSVIKLRARNRAAIQQEQLEQRWFPRRSNCRVVDDDDIFAYRNEDDDEGDDADDSAAEIEAEALKLMARIIQGRLADLKNSADQTSFDDEKENNNIQKNTIAIRNAQLAKDRFIDLTCTEEGERILEQLFETPEAAAEKDKEVVQGAVIALQSLLVFATQVGVKGSPAQLQRMIAHLDSRGNQEKFLLLDLEKWTTDSVRRLKYRIDRAPAIQLLSELQWKRTTQGAFDLLVELGAWQKHEDLPLLRSGFSLRFNQEELEAAEMVS